VSHPDKLSTPRESADGPFAAFKQSNGAPGLALYSGDPLNYDARVVEDRGGYRRVSLAYFRHVVADSIVPFGLRIDADHHLRAQVLTGRVAACAARQARPRTE
jgi:hypothetical protein